MNSLQKKISTEIGLLYLVASDKGLQGIFWKKQKILTANAASARKTFILNQAETQLHEYLVGKRENFDIPLDLQGSEFQKKVWRQLTKIPYGTTCSYKDIAKAIHNEKASRAVGTANGKNPLCVVVPCHRVISSDGSLGGYSGGIKIKKMLLELERNSSGRRS